MLASRLPARLLRGTAASSRFKSDQIRLGCSLSRARGYDFCPSAQAIITEHLADCRFHGQVKRRVWCIRAIVCISADRAMVSLHSAPRSTGVSASVPVGRLDQSESQEIAIASACDPTNESEVWGRHHGDPYGPGGGGEGGGSERPGTSPCTCASFSQKSSQVQVDFICDLDLRYSSAWICEAQRPSSITRTSNLQASSTGGLARAVESACCKASAPTPQSKPLLHSLIKLDIEYQTPITRAWQAGCCLRHLSCPICLPEPPSDVSGIRGALTGALYARSGLVFDAHETEGCTQTFDSRCRQARGQLIAIKK